MVGRPASAPFGRFPLGTDVSGRDILAGLSPRRPHLAPDRARGELSSRRVVGLTVGALAGYYGGMLDTVLMRATDFFLTIPSFVLAVVLIAIFRPSLVSVTGAIAAVSWPPIARLVRAEFIAQRDRDYVQACRGLGMSERTHHRLPDPAERPPARDRRGLAPRRDGDPHRIRPVVPGPQRPRRDVLGLHDRRRPDGPAHGALDGGAPRHEPS